jgi:hypothetical protein
VKDFQKIDWTIYNRPPYYQQWLCRGDTFKLASFGDKGLAGLDDHILRLKDQWDLDSTGGYFLDRMGKILKEKRNGNTDEVYRKYLKLRTMLNTADGTVNDIIKVVKFIYASREVKIVPDYPAGLVIEYDGEEQEYFDYNAILAQVIAAGVGFHTRAMFDFIEDPIIIGERSIIEAAADFVDSLEPHDAFGMKSEIILTDHVYGRTAIVYGGGIQGGAQYNGVYIHDGSLSYQREVIRYLHNGEITFGSGLNDIFASEDLSVTLHVDLRDEMPSRDELAVAAAADYSDPAPTARLYNGSIAHNGEYKWDAADDILELKRADDEDLSDPAKIEEGAAEIESVSDFFDSGNIAESANPYTVTLDAEDNAEMKDTLELFGSTDLSDAAAMSDDLSINMTGYWTYGGANSPVRRHDGSIGYNYGIIVPV